MPTCHGANLPQNLQRHNTSSPRVVIRPGKRVWLPLNASSGVAYPFAFGKGGPLFASRHSNYQQAVTAKPSFCRVLGVAARFFLDTNIFVYSFDASSPKKAAESTRLIRRAIETRGGIVSYQVVQEFFNVPLRRFAKPMTTLEAEQYLATTFAPLLSVHSSQALYAEALRLSARFHLAWYDALIVASAIEGQCDTLPSEDFQHGQQFGPVTTSNPFV